MARIELCGIHHTYSDASDKSSFSLDDLSVGWEDGSANALLGPSGCGKTTLLNLISGLLRPQQGSVMFDGRDVSALSPRERRIAQVFQFPVIYDSMNVEENLAFPLKNDGMSRGEIRKRVDQIADLLDLRDRLRHRAGQLTAGEKQRVSLGRGIVRTDTAAVLLDEPLTVIDPQQKYGLRRKLKEVQVELGLTMVYVTHDQQEALTFADHVTVMRNGDIEQTGSPHELYAEPASQFIGYFIGSPGMNFLEVEVRDASIFFKGQNIGESHASIDGDLTDAKTTTLGIRPEHVMVTSAKSSQGLATLVGLVEDTGAYKILTLEVEGVALKARVSESMTMREGDSVWVTFPTDACSFFQDARRVGGGV